MMLCGILFVCILFVCCVFVCVFVFVMLMCVCGEFVVMMDEVVFVFRVLFVFL